MTNETIQQNKARPLEIIAEMGKIAGKTIGNAALTTADILTAPFKIPTDTRRSLTAYDMREGSYHLVKGLTGLFVVLGSGLVATSGSKAAEYAFVGTLGANALSGVYEGLRYAYKKTEEKLNRNIHK